jgi:hypothetical protein
MKYYWCVNCGYHGSFGFHRERNIKCESCDYDSLASYEEDQWKEEGLDKKHIEDKNNKQYDGRYKFKTAKVIGKD